MTTSLGARIEAEVEFWARFSVEDGRLVRLVLTPIDARLPPPILSED